MFIVHVKIIKLCTVMQDFNNEDYVLTCELHVLSESLIMSSDEVDPEIHFMKTYSIMKWDELM